MSKISVLVTAELDKTMLGELSSVFDFRFAGYGKDYNMLSHDELKELCRDADILISEFDMVNEDILDGSSIKLIVCCRAGVSTVIDLKAAERHNVVVCNNVGRNKEATADFTIGLVYDLVRNISLTNYLIHSDRMSELCRPMPPDYGDSLWGLDGKSPYVVYRGPPMSKVIVGIVGYGQVGKTVARKFDRNGIHYLVNTRNPPKNDPRFVDLDTLLEKSDVVTIHVSGNKEKASIFGMNEFRKMKPTAYLINTSRGYIVNENDLYRALKDGIIAGAAIDVSSQEPMSPDNPLRELHNLILTPHIAGSSDDTIVYGTEMVIDALMGYVRGKVPNRVV